MPPESLNIGIKNWSATLASSSMGTLALLGSGETSSQGRKTHDYLFAQLSSPPVRVALIETPAGFQPNVHQVYEKIAAFMAKSLQNFKPQIEYVAAHRIGGHHDPNTPDIAAPILDAHYIFSGPGSPTYAARNLRDTLTLRYMVQAGHARAA